MTLMEEVNAVLLRKLPPKLKNPGSFTIPCRIGNHDCEHSSLDLGAGVNLMPYMVYEKLGLGELQPTSITLQLADRSIKRPRGILEDVLVKVVSLFYLLILLFWIWKKVGCHHFCLSF